MGGNRQRLYQPPGEPMVVRGLVGLGERVGEPPIVVRGRPSGDMSRESSAERLASSMARVDAEY